MEDFTITHIGDNALSLPMPFKFIPAKGKTFMFQSDNESNLGSKNEGIPITFENDFWMCAYQTTQEFWEMVRNEGQQSNIKESPSFFKGKRRPVEGVSWEDVITFTDALASLINLSNNIIKLESTERINGKFSLPSETQWEYAAQAEQKTVYAGSDHLEDIGWYKGNCYNQTMPVGLKQPNAFGLYDMSGNVLEWTLDDYLTNEFKEKMPTNPINKHKALKGGCYFDNHRSCFCISRTSYHHQDKSSNRGFRLVFF